MMERPFFDTSVLVAGVLDLGEASEAPQALFDALNEGKIQSPQTAWHCCLELFSVVTRMPPGLRLAPEDALQLVEQEILARFA
ncbi:MAG TPA: PIN domain-containing protein, partial [Thermoanaerobaculia bacterium]|nr:PIN domain-containing protein [Thermoanaerobaculia bacterium]